MQRSLFSSYYTTEADGEAAYDTSFLDDIVIVEENNCESSTKPIQA